jgi:uncharacterized protein
MADSLLHTRVPFGIKFSSIRTGREYSVIGDSLLSPNGSLDTFILHGAGESNRSRYDALRSVVLAQGVSSVAFDFVGHGDTGGLLSDSSLSERTTQALNVITHFAPHGPINLIGSSMGAYNAIKLTECLNVKTLVLLVPGVYHQSAYEIPFGPDFSVAIRKPRLWADSDAFKIISKFSGSLLVVAGELDPVIPLEIPERIVSAANLAQSRELLVVPAVGHSLLSALSEHRERFEGLAARIVKGVL